ncbi:hypothetical protein C8Q74DRAFT_444147 [Fomes fomentarius]|nr:hypothetical protein C8Q74DRAFT_444147 [Fomes fomentarius]
MAPGSVSSTFVCRSTPRLAGGHLIVAQKASSFRFHANSQVSPGAFRSRRVRQDGRVSCDCDRVVVHSTGSKDKPADARLYLHTSHPRLREMPSYAWYGLAGWNLTSEIDLGGTVDCCTAARRRVADGAQRRAAGNAHAPRKSSSVKLVLPNLEHLRSQPSSRSSIDMCSVLASIPRVASSAGLGLRTFGIKGKHTMPCSIIPIV